MSAEPRISRREAVRREAALREAHERSHEMSRLTPALSPSVVAAIDRVGPDRVIQAWDLVQALLQSHAEYGGGVAELLLSERGPAKGSLRRTTEWIDAVCRLLNEKAVSELHGRLLIIGLCRLDSDLEQYLHGLGFLPAVIDELRDPLDEIFLAAPTTIETGQPDATPLHLDSPASADSLGRRGFARALAIRLDRVWNEYNAANVQGSFVLHLHGPWGSGKTSLLNLLRTELQPKGAKRSRRRRIRSEKTAVASDGAVSRWIVVDFNAWQHQRLEAPWWLLMDAIYRQARTQLGGVFHKRWHAWRLCIRETVWRLITLRRDVFTLVGFGMLLLATIYWIGRSLPSGLPSIVPVESTGDVNDILAVCGTLISAGLIVSRSLLSGSARSAQAFVQAGADPMERIAKHFHDLVGTIDHPIVIFVDDLDRCQPAYVVQLLEGIQTLFYDPRVIYVIAGDRRWLHVCFETQYEKFNDAVGEPGRRLGTLFLEKVFELSVALPRLGPDQQADYWRELLRGASKEADEEMARYEMEAREEFGQLGREPEIVQRVSQQRDNPLRQRARRQAAVERLASTQVEKTTEVFLERFSALLEPNPRAMKRLLNAYSIYRDLAILRGINVLADLEMRRRLALWTILCSRWPDLEDRVLDLARSDSDDEREAAMSELIVSDSIRQVFDGEGIGVALDLGSIAVLTGLRPAS